MEVYRDADGWIRRVQAETTFGEAQPLVVKDRGGERCLYIGDLCQSKAVLKQGGGIKPEQPWDLVRIMTLWGAAWIQHRSGSRGGAAKAASVLIAGLGGGSLTRALTTVLPAISTLDSVEVDAAVAKAAIDWMGFVETDHSRLHVADGRVFIREAADAGRRYDLLFLDMFTGKGIAKEAGHPLAINGILLRRLTCSDLF